MKITKMKILFTICLILLPLLNAKAQLVDKIVALVNNNAITQSDLQDASVKYSSKTKALDELINERVLEAEISRANINITDEEVGDHIKEVMSQNKYTEEKLNQELASKNMTLEIYREQTRKQLERQKFFQQSIYPRILVSDLDLQKFYNRNKNKYTGFKRVRFNEIFVTNESSPGKNPAELAMDIYNQLEKGASFSTLAHKYSKGAYAVKGGDSGFLEMDGLNEELKSVLLVLKKGIVTRPIPVQGGFFIFKLVDTEETTFRDYNEVKNMVQQDYMASKVEEELERYLMEARSRHYIDVRE